MRRPVSSISRAKLLAGHGSICTSEVSVTPRRAIAACQRGSALMASALATHSSSRIGAWAPGTSVTSTTAPSSSDTVTHWTSRAALSYVTQATSRGTGVPSQPRTSALGGSASVQ